MRPLPHPAPLSHLLKGCLPYKGNARYIALYRDIYTDMPVLQDGRAVSIAILSTYEELMNYLKDVCDVNTDLFGTKDEPPICWLIIDLQENQFMLTSPIEARQFLAEQWKTLQDSLFDIRKLVNTIAVLDSHNRKQDALPADEALAAWRIENQFLGKLWDWIRSQKEVTISAP